MNFSSFLSRLSRYRPRLCGGSAIDATGISNATIIIATIKSHPLLLV
jgi:hypothetical protein